MVTFNDFCIKTFGGKAYKLALNGGMTCPNRDGKAGTGGCIFCSAGGSGDFTPPPSMPVDEQIERAKRMVSKKYRGEKYIAYFQAFSNTYAPVSYLRELYESVITRDDIVCLDIATRPDCIDDDVIGLISELNRIKPVWVELGLQTSKPDSAKYIRRGYENAVYADAVKRLNVAGVHTVTHIILGLPGESTEDMVNSVRFAVTSGTKGIKLQLLYVLEGTDLADDYRAGMFETLSPDMYIEILKKCISVLPEDTVVHRLTGDGPKRLLIAPLWSGDKKKVLNRIKKELGAENNNKIDKKL